MRAAGAGRRWTLGTIAAVGLAIAAAAVGLSAQGAPPPELLKVRLGGDMTQTRVVVDLQKPVSGKLLSDGAADRLVVIGLPDVSVGLDMEGTGQGLVQSWSVERKGGQARLKIALLRDAVVARRFLLPPGDGVKTYRYVIDLQGRGPAPPMSQVAAAAPMAPTRIKAPAPATRKVIVIDAGHGGKDPGAAGDRSREKDINLAAARALKVRLERSGRYRVVLTRSDDTFVPLEQRVAIARRAQADLFISLHADSGPETAQGASVYTLSEKGERRVGQVLRRDDQLFNINYGSPTVGQILLDLTQRSTKNRSAGFAELMLDHISTCAPLLRRSHRDGSLVVLLAPDVPAVLLEMGFITNDADERRLIDPAGRRRMMDAVGDSIDAWFAARPMAG
ncbi:N-acetylmuramoyl-L-alanine amidase [Caulobacter ginsengisoli]|uniref:N-acetylmuramoyl-L-alanine amidase n=1 Tax=Caulobacter ginsengisoli TaxID=400775 RepID=A0ABU0ILI0_9CAUL|nr:N-acetylmuramoyl-L-alanine amidase [Caulobacter ginsengisoli]MDQ0462873.1 N-acetylmuramoyl-L-alanine amidase [Caulobacter ginsengisoli]